MVDDTFDDEGDEVMTLDDLELEPVDEVSTNVISSDVADAAFEQYRDVPTLEEKTDPADIPAPRPTAPRPTAPRPTAPQQQSSGRTPAGQSAELRSPSPASPHDYRSAQQRISRDSDESADQRSQFAPRDAGRASSGVPARAPADHLGAVSGKGPQAPVPDTLKAQGAPRLPTQSEGNASYPRSGSGGFYELQTGQTGEFDGIQRDAPKKERTVGRSVLRGIAASVPVALIAFCLVAYFAIDRWLTPQEVILWTVLGVCFPVLFVSLLAGWPPEGQKSSAKLWIAAMLPGVLLAGLAGGAAFGWHQPDVREIAFQYAPNNPVVLSKAWEENHAPIAIEACKRMVERADEPAWRVALLRNLSLRPAAGAQCLRSIKDEDLLAKTVATVMERWHKDLLTADDARDEQRLCQVATSMSELPTREENIDSRLLTCALAAPNEAAQGCCASILAEKVKNADDMVERVRSSLDNVAGRTATARLMSMAFHQHDLTRPQQTLASQLELREPPAQLATLQLACENMTDHGDLSIVSHFAASLGKRCGIDERLVPLGVEDWTPVCEASLAELIQDSALDPREELCRAAQLHFRGLAIDAAQRFVNHAVRSNRRSGLGHSIDIGYHKEREAQTSPEEYQAQMREQMQLIESGMSPEEAARTVGIDYAAMYRNAPRYQGTPENANSALEGIMGKVNSVEGAELLGEKDAARFRDAARAAGFKISNESGERPSEKEKKASSP